MYVYGICTDKLGAAFTKITKITNTMCKFELWVLVSKTQQNEYIFSLKIFKKLQQTVSAWNLIYSHLLEINQMATNQMTKDWIL